MAQWTVRIPPFVLEMRCTVLAFDVRSHRSVAVHAPEVEKHRALPSGIVSQSHGIGDGQRHSIEEASVSARHSWALSVPMLRRPDK